MTDNPTLERRWQMKPRTGTHTRRLADGSKQVYRPGDIVVCTEIDLGAAVDKFIALDPPAPPPQPRIQPKLRARGGGWWDVIHPETGKQMNQNGMRYHEAAMLCGLDPKADPPEDDGAMFADEDVDE